MPRSMVERKEGGYGKLREWFVQRPGGSTHLFKEDYGSQIMYDKSREVLGCL